LGAPGGPTLLVGFIDYRFYLGELSFYLEALGGIFTSSTILPYLL
jgi:hypothetical protein